MFFFSPKCWHLGWDATLRGVKTCSASEDKHVDGKKELMVNLRFTGIFCHPDRRKKDENRARQGRDFQRSSESNKKFVCQIYLLLVWHHHGDEKAKTWHMRFRLTWKKRRKYNQGLFWTGILICLAFTLPILLPKAFEPRLQDRTCQRDREHDFYVITNAPFSQETQACR